MEMKKILLGLGILALVSGCANNAPAPPSQKEIHQAAIRNIKNVEILYHPDRYVVMDLGGSGGTGMGGLFGPIGMLVALGVDAGSKLTFAERAEARSKEFTAAVRASYPGRDLDAEFADKLADLLRKQGRTVSLTKIERPAGDPLGIGAEYHAMHSSAADANVVLRITTGYGAASATSSYEPLIVVEYALVQNKRILVDGKISINDGKKSYLTFPELLGNHKEAVDEISRILSAVAERADNNMFDVSRFASKSAGNEGQAASVRE
jgi:hypothetical protein